MLTKRSKKIDPFYLIFSLMILVLALPLIYTASRIFSAFISAYEVDSSLGREARLDVGKIEEAVNLAYDKEMSPLEIRETAKLVTAKEIEK